MAKYLVTVARTIYGTVEVDAEDDFDSRDVACSLSCDEFSWSEGFDDYEFVSSEKISD